MAGRCNNCFKEKETLGLIGETNFVLPKDLIERPWPLPMYIWSGPSNGPSYCMFRDSPVTWKDAAESDIQVVELGS